MHPSTYTIMASTDEKISNRISVLLHSTFFQITMKEPACAEKQPNHKKANSTDENLKKTAR